jgi:hypothetical protein
MRKLLFGLCMLVVLAACSSNEAKVTSGPATTETEGKVYESALGEVFHYYRTNSVTNITSKIAITVTDPEVVDFVGDDTNKERFDFVKVFMQVHNVGDTNSGDAVGANNFTVYDANGKEISSLYYVTEATEGIFKGTELRPDGKNEGYMYLPIEEGSVPAEIIFYDSTLRGAHTNQFVIKMQ